MAQTLEQLQARQAELNTKLKARANVPGLAQNVKALEAEIERVKGEIAALQSV